MVEEMVYTSWDASPTTPPKARARDPAQVPRLSTLTWQRDRPSFPAALLQKFAEGTHHHAEISKLKTALEAMWPASEEAPTTQSGQPSPVTARAVGSPDFTGENLLDLTRMVDLAQIKTQDFSEEKLLCHT